MLRRKERWAQWVTVFSAPRMFNQLNLPARPMEIALSGANPEVAQRMRLFNGLKVLLTVYLVFGNSFLYTYYSIVTDPV